jgi:hypothetical protein
MRIILTIVAVFFLGFECHAQTFEKKLRLDSCSRFGRLWGRENKRWPFLKKLKSGISDDLFNQILPKSTLEKNKIILNQRELSYFLEIEQVQMTPKGIPISNPDHCANRFGKQIQTIEFNKPLYALVIKDNKLVKVTLNAMAGISYHTFYPYGEVEITDKKMAPIVYSQQNMFDVNSPILFVTSKFIQRTNLEKARVNRETISFGTKDYPGKLHKTGIDSNGDGQNEVLMYYETVEDKTVEEGDESSAYQASMIALFVKGKWYRTSYWETGPDGIVGF